MFSDHELAGYFERHQLRPEAREYIRRVRQDGPSRPVGKYANGNVIVQFNSKKMSRPITVESHSIELVFARMCEFDDNILEFYDQPGAIDIYPVNRNGKKRRNIYHSDFLILTTSGPRVVQTKPKNALDKLVERQPENWAKDGEIYVHIPAAKAFADLGIKHQVNHFDNVWAPTLSVNLGLILQAPVLDSSDLQEIQSRIDSAFQTKAWMTLEELAALSGFSSFGPIFSLLREKNLHALLYKQLLSEPSTALIATDSRYLNHAFVHAKKDKMVTVDSESMVPVEHVPSPLQAAEALKRIERLDEDSRAGRRYRSLVKRGKEEGLTAFQALIPKYHRRGNGKRKIANEVKAYLEAYLESEDFSDARDISKQNAYVQYTENAKEAHSHLKPVSEKTFALYIAGLDCVEHSRRRKGKRGANAAKSPSETSSRVIKSTVPFAIATIDHYNVDLRVVLGREGEKLITARCWMTALVDLATKDVLGWYISLHPPSRISCAMVIRDCIRRHGKLPAAIITDRGADFTSIYFSAMLSNFDIERRLRPASESRYGSEVERLFLAFKEERLNTLPGNIKGIAHDRSVSSSHSPGKTAMLTPEELINQLDIWLNWRRTKLIGAAIETTEEKVNKKSKQYEFVGKTATLDHATYVLTAIDSKRYKVDQQRGIHTGDGLHYWHPKLSEVRHGSHVEVRKEPEDPYRIYALINGNWVACTSTEEVVFQAKGTAAQRSEAFLFFTPHSLKYERKLEAKQRLIALQGSLSDFEENSNGRQEKPPLDQIRSVPQSLFDSVELCPEDELEIDHWEIEH